MKDNQSLHIILFFVLVIGLIASAFALKVTFEPQAADHGVSAPQADTAEEEPAAAEPVAPEPAAEEPAVEEALRIQTDIPSLHEYYADAFDVGVAISASQIEGAYADLVNKHYNTVVAGNEMKPGSLQPVEDFFRWKDADNIIAFAKANGLKVRFHTLVWHQQTADWMFRDPYGLQMEPTEENKKLLLERLEKHIRAVVERYKDDIQDWDVVNEVIDENEPDGMRRSKWYEITGTEYIELAFRVTREVAGPDARLYINDYNTHHPKKREALYKLVTDLLDKGVPIDGVGHQTHISIYYPQLSEIQASIERFAELGLDNQITELDISIYASDSESYDVVPEEVLVKLAHRYQELFELFLDMKDHISSVVFWGTDDGNTWLRTFPVNRINLPLLFDEQLQAKYAYWALIDPSQVPALPSDEPADAGEKKLGSAVKGTPVIDGEMEEIWNNAPELFTDVWVEGSQGAQATARVLWDDGYLYVFAKVRDTLLSKSSANPWEQDSLEIFVDQNHGQTGSYEPDDGQYRVNFDNEQSYNGMASADNFVTATKVIEGGYVVEAALQLDPTWIKGGAKIGFDVQVNNDEDGDGVRDSVAIWSDPTGQSYQNTSNLGELVLE